VLDSFMKQPYPVMSSMVVADKYVGSGTDNLTACVSNIMGICDLKTISLNSTLTELGMDSMTAVEVKEILARKFEINLSPQEIQNLTFARLDELSAGNRCTEVNKRQWEDQSVDNEVPLRPMQLLLRVCGNEASVTQPVVRLPSASGSGTDVEDDLKAGPILFMLPGLEGMASVLEPLARNLKYQTVCLQLGYSHIGQTVQDMAQALLPHIHSRLAPRAPFRLLGYSFGGLLALELALKLEAEGREGKLYLMDSAPDCLKTMLTQSMASNEDELQTSLICAMFILIAPHEATSAAVNKLIQEITPLKSWDQKLDHFVNISPLLRKDAEHYRAFGVSVMARLKAISDSEWNYKNSIKSQTILLRPDGVHLNTAKDYGLSKCCEKAVEVHFVTGNHVTILGSKDTANVINREVTNIDAVNSRHNRTQECLL